MTSVEDLVAERQAAVVREIAESRGWAFEQVGPRRFRVSLATQNGDIYQVEVEYDGFPVQPPAFHWRNPESGRLDDLPDSPAPYDYFHGTGRICAPWNRLASTPGGPHLEWVQTSWQDQPETKGTVTLAAMVLRIHQSFAAVATWGVRDDRETLVGNLTAAPSDPAAYT